MSLVTLRAGVLGEAQLADALALCGCLPQPSLGVKCAVPGEARPEYVPQP